MLVFCPECRTVVAPYWKHCRYCGARVDKVPVSRHPPAPISAAPPPKLETSESELRRFPLPRVRLPPPLTAKAAVGAAKARRIRLPYVPGSRGAAIVVTSLSAALVVCSAMQTGGAPMFSPEDRYIAAFALRSTPVQTAEPTPESRAPGPSTVEATPTPPPESSAVPTAPLPVVEEEVAPPEDEGPSGNRGRGNGRGNGGGSDDDD